MVKYWKYFLAIWSHYSWSWTITSEKDKQVSIINHFTLVIYDSRVVPDLKIPHITTLES